MDRRHWLTAAVFAPPAGWLALSASAYALAADQAQDTSAKDASAKDTAATAAVPLQAPAPLAQLHVSRQGQLLAVTRSGALLQAGATGWQPLGAGLDPGAPIASGHGRVVGRSAAGGLWVLESGRVQSFSLPGLAPHAGLLVLALGIVAIVSDSAGTHRVVRLDAAGGGWAESARFAEPVLPDACPLQFDPAGTAAGPQADDHGHVVVFGAPSDSRYRHGVLGDSVEPTALLLLERHGLTTLARMDLPPPHVFEDIAPRPMAWRGGRALLTVRSGPLGAQLCVVASSAQSAARGRFELAALAEPIGTLNRWLSPSTDGHRLLAVNTPHIGGVLHRHVLTDGRLASQALARGVSNHAIGTRNLDVSAWVGPQWVVPAQDRHSLRVVDADAPAPAAVPLGTRLAAPVLQLVAWHRGMQAGVAALLQDGTAWWLPVRA